MTELSTISQSNRIESIKSIDFWRRNKTKIWILGLVLRLLVTPFEVTTRDYKLYILPIAEALADGGDLYNDVSYNQMPIYPYLNAIAVLISNDNDFLVRFFIKLPSILADLVNVILLYKIGVKINREKIGLISSILYSLNPISLYEISSARWDVFANMFVLLAFYYLLLDKPIHVGIFVSLGFLSKEFPLFFVGSIIIYWHNYWKKILLSASSFLILTTALVATVLIPSQTSVKSMIDNLLDHPVYKESASSCGSACHSPIQYLIYLIGKIIYIPSTIYVISWILFFIIFSIIPMYQFYKSPSDVNLINVVVIHSTLLAIFFWSIHYQYILWLYPWAIFASINRREYYIPILLTVAFPFRYREYNLLNGSLLFSPGNILLLVTGTLILYRTIRLWYLTDMSENKSQTN